LTIQITDSELQAALPDLESTVRLPGLASPAAVYRDRWGIPHIRAHSEWDLFFAQGFATAQDRLWQMDFDRHQALGRWSELAGTSGVARDRLMRAAGMGRTAKLDYEASSPQARAMVDAYTAGVNAFITGTCSLPIEYALLEMTPEAWENWHCLAVYKIRNTLLGTFEPKLLRTRLLQKAGGAEALARIIRGYPAGHLITVPPGAEYQGPRLNALDELIEAAGAANWLGETDVGSNAWSLAGSRTASGLPLIAGDSHRGLDAPSVYYQVHLSCPGLNVIGSSVPGVPGALHFAHNDRVGWGMTYGSADTQDLFAERFREGGGGREYEFEGAWRPAEVLVETIRVRGDADVGMEVTITHHGPVIAGDPVSGWGVAIGDPGLGKGTPWLDAALAAMKAGDMLELREAFRKWTDRVNNYAVADCEGNFGYLHAGKIPVRGQANGWRAVEGWTGQFEWNGYIPHDELPAAINPEVGYAITCNQRVAAHDYPYYVGLSFAPEFRARRVQLRLLDLDPGAATVADMARIHADMTSTPARILIEALLVAEALDDRSREALALLGGWDFRMDRDTVPPTIYAKTRGRMVRRLAVELFDTESAQELLSGAAGTDAHLRLLSLEMTLAIQRGDTDLLPEGETWPGALAAALTEAVAALAAELGPDMKQWHWGRLHRTRPRHPLSPVFPNAAQLLDPPSLSIHGDGDTPLAGSYAAHDEFTATGMSVNRYIHDPSDWSKSIWIVPLGASGHPASPHYADQAERWANVEYIPQLWDWGMIEDEAETVQRLEPVYRRRG